MGNPYEDGYRDGLSAAQEWKDLGFPSPQESLVHNEQVYQDEIRSLSRQGDYAPHRQQYMEGWIAGCRTVAKEAQP